VAALPDGAGTLEEAEAVDGAVEGGVFGEGAALVLGAVSVALPEGG